MLKMLDSVQEMSIRHWQPQKSRLAWQISQKLPK